MESPESPAWTEEKRQQVAALQRTLDMIEVVLKVSELCAQGIIEL